MEKPWKRNDGATLRCESCGQEINGMYYFVNSNLIPWLQCACSKACIRTLIDKLFAMDDEMTNLYITRRYHWKDDESQEASDDQDMEKQKPEDGSPQDLL